MIGFERELSDKPAGLRTTMLVILGAALFTFISPMLADINTTRIAANVVVGIGFIGAGTIMQGKGRIQGITTAATMWVCAALGMMIGGMLYWDAFIVTIFVVLILNVIGRIEHLRKKKG
jgi:putative Mg2+ transporter-C (MgtC) family protein